MLVHVIWQMDRYQNHLCSAENNNNPQKNDIEHSNVTCGKTERFIYTSKDIHHVSQHFHSFYHQMDRMTRQMDRVSLPVLGNWSQIHHRMHQNHQFVNHQMWLQIWLMTGTLSPFHY